MDTTHNAEPTAAGPLERRRLVAFFAAFALLTVGLAGWLSIYNFRIDPLQYYRAPTRYKPVLWPGFQRQQIPGLARNHAKDIVVVGSSVTENYLNADIEPIWGKPSIRLSMSGSTPHEQFLALRLALGTGRVRDVLWSFDYGAFILRPDLVREQKSPFPWHLYRTGYLPNFEYLLSLSTYRMSALALKGYGDTDFDKYHNWYAALKFGQDVVLGKWSGKCADFKQRYEPSDQALYARNEHLSTMRESVEKNVLSLVRAHPDVRFHIILPPAILPSLIPAKMNLPLLLGFRSMLDGAVKPFANVSIHDFQSDESIVADLNRFTDTIHFDLDTTRKIIRSVKDGDRRVSPGDMAKANAGLIDLANGYDLCRPGGPLEGKR